ncbi:MAG TPA: cardiolipin synthase [Planctomycetes bacterium]|nr:cardiolipin synthase [Planctomycetota bacterium]
MSVLLPVVVTAVGYLIAFFLIPLVLVQRRESGATLAWVLTLLFLPYLGVFLFLAIGAQSIRRRRKRRQRARAIVAPRVAGSTEALQKFEGATARTAPAGLPETATQLAQLADELALPACGGNEVGLLIDADQTYAALEAAIERARSHVHLEYYIWRPDEVGRRLRDRLVVAAQSGVEVRVLVDDVGSRSAGGRFWKPLTLAGGHVARSLRVNLISRWLLLNLNNRNHRKIVVIDGVVAFAGGMNVSAVQERDTHLRVEGPAAERLQEVFVEDWFHATREDLASPRYFPEPASRGEALVQILASGPDEGDSNAIETIYFAALTLAKERVWLSTPYFVPNVSFTMALRTAALRGVDVRLLIPKTPDQPFVYHASRSFFPELVRAGVSIYEFDGGQLHAKTATVDGCWATVGSANLDTRSFKLNFEANIVVYGPALAGQLERAFERDLGSARPVSLAEFAGLGRLERTLQGAARVVAPLL